MFGLDQILKLPSIALLLLFPVLVAAVWLATFLNTHLLHESSISTYLDESYVSASWALVTGASDGIGFGFAEELASLGFNVVLHGRNRTKLDGLVQNLKAKFPQRRFQILMIDVSKREDWQAALKAFVVEIQQINLKILVNNVGGTGGSFNAFDKMSERDPEAITKAIDVNATFPAVITHALLPVLEAHQPSLVVNISSITALLPPPYLGLYAGCKAFNLIWSQSLWAEMKAENLQVEILGVLVGRVLNANTKDKEAPSLFNPEARKFASATLGKVGCGKSAVFGYWAHELQILPLKLLPGWVTDVILREATLKQIESEKQDR